MKRISAKSKLGQHFVEAYERSVMFTLEDAYTKPSAAKQAAFERCQQICKAEKYESVARTNKKHYPYATQ